MVNNLTEFFIFYSSQKTYFKIVFHHIIIIMYVYYLTITRLIVSDCRKKIR